MTGTITNEEAIRVLIWSPNHATGIDQIDAHNQSLFFLLRGLFASDLPCERRLRTCHKIQDAVRYLERNFLREQALMDRAGYPERVRHRAEHWTLLKELRRMQLTLECGHYDSAEMFDLLSGWVLDHVERWDKSLGRYLRGLTHSPDADDDPTSLRQRQAASTVAAGVG